jgi:glycosyltransferase involved in cell wall biosynthesis
VSVPALAETLARAHEVTLITDAARADLLHEPPAGVRRVLATPPTDWRRAGFSTEHHAWAAAVLNAMELAYEEGRGPDLVEAPDYRGEAHVVLQAARSGHPLLDRAQVVVRLRGSAELALLHNEMWPEDEETLAGFAMEREALTTADRLLVAGGAAAEAYARYYGEGALAPVRIARLPLADIGTPIEHEPRKSGDPLRLTYAGRLERRKGVLELVEAVLRVPDASIILTFVGGDTRTAPLERSMLAVITAMAAGDERIVLAGPRRRDEVLSMMSQSDVVVLPSRFEWWANTAQESLAVGTPVLATPVGGFVEQVVPGETGWLTTEVSSEALARSLAELTADPSVVDAVRRRGGCRGHVESLTCRSTVLDAYRALIEEGPSTPRPTRGPLTRRMTAVVPTRDDGAAVTRAVESFLTCAGPVGDVVVVDDGSGHDAFAHLDRLRTTDRVRVIHRCHGGPSAARNTGLRFADGDFVLLLDADDEVLPGFLQRAASTLDADPQLAWAVPWYALHHPDGDEGAWCPLGTAHDVGLKDLNTFGGSCVVVRRRVFDDAAVCFESSNVVNQDREFLEVLSERGYRGCVVPMLGVQYNVRRGGISHSLFPTYRQIALREIRARRRLREVVWTTR